MSLFFLKIVNFYINCIIVKRTISSTLCSFEPKLRRKPIYQIKMKYEKTYDFQC